MHRWGGRNRKCIEVRAKWPRDVEEPTPDVETRGVFAAGAVNLHPDFLVRCHGEAARRARTRGKGFGRSQLDTITIDENELGFSPSRPENVCGHDYRFIARRAAENASRFASRSLMTWRLSPFFFPRASASSAFT